MQAAIPSTMFDYNAETQVMCVEDSTIQNYTRGSSMKSIKIHSSRTGNVVTFLLAEVVRDDGGDIVMWLYKNNKVAVKIHVYND
jgi:hypothetical protein